MKERIKRFIDYKGISPGDLATALEVQRSNISHILNGRNKPGAAFIEKFLLVYPDLNARWLLTGEGEMINVAKKELEHSLKKLTKSDTNESDNPSKKKQTKDDKTEEKKIVATEDKTVTESIPTPPAASGKKVEKVLLLQSDGTFIYYQPE